MTIAAIFGLVVLTVAIVIACWLVDVLLGADTQTDKEVEEMLRRMEQEYNERPRVRAGTSPKADRRDVRGTY